MNKKTLLKSILGTLGIFLVLVAFIFIFILPDIIDVLGDYPVCCGVMIGCSVAAGLLFKGKIYAWVWSAASVIFLVAIMGGYLPLIIVGVWYVLAPLIIPFLIVKAIFLSFESGEEEQQRGAFKTALDDSKEKQNEEIS